MHTYAIVTDLAISMRGAVASSHAWWTQVCMDLLVDVAMKAQSLRAGQSGRVCLWACKVQNLRAR